MLFPANEENRVSPPAVASVAVMKTAPLMAVLVEEKTKEDVFVSDLRTVREAELEEMRLTPSPVELIR